MKRKSQIERIDLFLRKYLLRIRALIIMNLLQNMKLPPMTRMNDIKLKYNDLSGSEMKKREREKEVV
jgi:hypothetical protein